MIGVGALIPVTNLTVVSPTQVTATLNISRLAPLGVRNLGITTPGGASNTEPFTVTGGTPAFTGPAPALTTTPAIAVRKRWYRGELADAKDTRRRQIPIPETLLPMLLLLKDRTRYRGPEDFVLTSRSRAAINVTNITARRLGVIGKRLEMPELTWQVLRRAQSAMKQAYGPQFQYQIAAAHYRCEHAVSSPSD